MRLCPGGFFLQELSHGLSQKLEVVEVHTGIGLIDQCEPRALRHELQEFRFLDFPAPKASIHFALEEVDSFHTARELADSGTVETGPETDTHELGEGYARDPGEGAGRRCRSRGELVGREKGA